MGKFSNVDVHRASPSSADPEPADPHYSDTNKSDITDFGGIHGVKKKLNLERGSLSFITSRCSSYSESLQRARKQGNVVVTLDPSRDDENKFTSTVTMGRRELDQVINEETDNLYKYLRTLYTQGLEQAHAGHEMEKEAWDKRMQYLQNLLQERDEEVGHLQRLINAREEELGQKDAHILRQAKLVGEQAARIKELLQQSQCIPSKSPPEHTSGSTYASLLEGQSFSKVALQASSHYVQLPRQSQYQTYREYESCGLWQVLMSSFFIHRKRWIWGGFLLALVLLLIILLATLIPSSKGRAAIQFIQPPVISATGANFFDITVQLSRPSIVSYMVFKTADQLQQVPGTDKTLLHLIQSNGASGGAIVDAAASTNSLQASTMQPGLQQLAIACGWAPVPNSHQNELVSVVSLATSQSAACTKLDVPRRCARCPHIPVDEDVTILMVAAGTRTDAMSPVQVLNTKSTDIPLNINSIRQPYVSNLTSNSFVLNIWLNAPGILYYVIQHEMMFSRFGPYDLAFTSAAPSSSAVRYANSADFAGAIVANGSISVTTSRQWLALPIKPPCTGDLCRQSLNGLQGETPYKVYLSSIDLYGNIDPAPALLSLTTRADVSPPSMLSGSGPMSITATSFDFNLSLNKAGGVYYMLLSAKPSASVIEPEISAGTWAALTNLPNAQGRRLLQDAPTAATPSSRTTLQDAAPVAGSLTLPTCHPTNVTCRNTLDSVFGSAPGLSAFDIISSGCMAAPAAGQQFKLPTILQLQNNTLYYMAVATEDQRVPDPLVQTKPDVYAVRTVDLSAPKFTCGFPTVTNITSSSMSISVMLTKPAWAFYVVLPTSQGGSGPSAAEILQGKGPGGLQAASFGNMTSAGSLPWESGTMLDRKKLWADISGLQAGISYTVFVTLTEDGVLPVSGSPVATISNIVTPATVPPTITAISATNKNINEASGTFSVDLKVVLDRPGILHYTLYRNYSCISGNPTISEVVSGSALPSSICRCSEAWYCSLVASGSFHADAGSQESTTVVSGGLAPLPFEDLRDGTDSQLRCFRGGIGQASDTYNIYIVAGSSLPTYNGLASSCANLAQAMATAAAADRVAVSTTCPVNPSISCSQAQTQPDTRVMQSGSIIAWLPPTQNGGVVAWQPKPDATVTGRPAKVQLVLGEGAPPAFTVQPEFPVQQRLPDALFMQFKLNKPALVVYAVSGFKTFNPEFDVFPTPVLVATGRVPVFQANQFYNATIRACTGQGWPSGSLRANTQYTVQYVARDRYGRMDGPCPDDQPTCVAYATTGRS